MLVLILYPIPESDPTHTKKSESTPSNRDAAIDPMPQTFFDISLDDCIVLRTFNSS